MINPTIYSYIKEQETNYESDEVQIGENWYWNMRRHIQLIFHLKHDKFYTGDNDWLRSFKNIMRPILNLAYWTEDLEVKDAVFYVQGSEKDKALSFLLKKYHDEVYTKEHNLDELFDEITESDIDYGGVLVKRGKERPEAITLNSIAFCDQTDILGSPLGFKFYFSPDKLKQMKKFGWGESSNGATISVDDLIIIADNQKSADGSLNEKDNDVPGKTIEVYIVEGDMPSAYLNDDDDFETYVNQIQIVGFYTDEKGAKQGVTLYRNKRNEDLKFFTSHKIHNRALGEGVGEQLLHPQIWTNFLTIHKTRMLEAGAKSPLITDDPAFKNKARNSQFENNEIFDIAEGTNVRRLETIPTNNIQLYSNSINEWFEHAQFEGAAFDPILGKEAVSGTTFRGQERTVAQGRGLHDRRRGKRAKFIEEIYRDWIIPDMIKEITKGKSFMASLSSDELAWVAETMATKAMNDKIKEKMFKMEIMSKEERDSFKEAFKESVVKAGDKKLMKILKDEFKGFEIKVGINIANKQKNLADLSDKVLSIFQFIFANPQGFQQAMQIPALSKSFADILEFSGLSIADFNGLINPPKAQPTLEQEQAPQGQAGLEGLRQPQVTE